MTFRKVQQKTSELLSAMVCALRYARQTPTGREGWSEIVERAALSLPVKYRDEAKKLLLEKKVSPSGRWLWIGGTEYSKDPNNVAAFFNCTNFDIGAENQTHDESLEVIIQGALLSMQGCGVGLKFSDNLPSIKRKVTVALSKKPGEEYVKGEGKSTTFEWLSDVAAEIVIGDSREAWAKAYRLLLQVLFTDIEAGDLHIQFNLGKLRPKGTPLKGFGGIANPDPLYPAIEQAVKLVNATADKGYLSVPEWVLLVDTLYEPIAAGSIRRVAGMRMAAATTGLADAKRGMYKYNPATEEWAVDPMLRPYRVSNHTVWLDRTPCYEEIYQILNNQLESGEGALLNQNTAIARANVDLAPLHPRPTTEEGWRDLFLEKDPWMPIQELNHRVGRYGLNPCGEIIGKDFFCNLGEINVAHFVGADDDEIKQAFKIAAHWVCERLKQPVPGTDATNFSQELDPIVGIGITGVFDYWVGRFGKPYLQWIKSGRPNEYPDYAIEEQKTYTKWKTYATNAVRDYCKEWGLKAPNRCTTVKPSGTLSLVLGGVCSGWHLPVANQYIRRITVQAQEPVAIAALELGFNVIAIGQDLDGNSFHREDIYNAQVKDWMIEIPGAVSWANLAQDVGFDPDKIPAETQLKMWHSIQKYWAGHNTSATIFIREGELADAANWLHENWDDYVSAAFMPRFEVDTQVMPNLPFEPVTYEQYLERAERVIIEPDALYNLIRRLDVLNGSIEDVRPPSECDGHFCPLKSL